MDIKARIESAKKNLKAAEQAKTVAETQLKTAEKQLEEVKEEMAAEGVAPETIVSEIDKLEQTILNDLTKVETLIPKV